MQTSIPKGMYQGVYLRMFVSATNFTNPNAKKQWNGLFKTQAMRCKHIVKNKWKRKVANKQKG